MPEQDPWEEAAKNFKGQTGAPAAPAAAASGNDDWKLWTKGAGQPAAPQQPGFFQRLYENTLGGPVSLVQKYGQHIQENSPKYGIMAGFPALGQTALDVGNGITDSFTNAASKTGAALKSGDIGHAAQQAIGMAPMIGPPMVQASEDSEHGNYGAAAGDVLGFGASMAAPQIMKGAGKMIGAPAEPIAETALNVRKLDRAYGKNPGQAILDETKGVRPATIANSAQGRLGDLNSRLKGMAAQSNEPASLAPAREVIQAAIRKAQTQNNGKAIEQLKPLADQLSINTVHGTPLAETQMPSGILNLKRGFGDSHVHNWNPETMSGTKSTAANAYHALDAELDRTVPGADELNQRISSLIPVAKRAESTDLNANTLQRTLGRIARPTGALTGAISGAYEGAHHFGPLGGVVGGLVGLGLPELASSPTAQMIAARGLNATERGLQTAAPVLGNSARIGSLIKPKQQEQK